MARQNSEQRWLCPHWKAHVKDNHACFMGTICSLEAFSAIPTKNMAEGTGAAINKGAEFRLMHHLFKADHHNYKTVNQAWLRLSFPWFAGYSILRGLDVLTKLGYVKDQRVSDAIRIILQKRQANGVWTLEDSPMGRMQTNIEKKGYPSKWITLIALRVLKGLGTQA